VARWKLVDRLKFGLDFAGSLAGPLMAAAGALVAGDVRNLLVAGGIGLAAISWWVRRLLGRTAAENKSVKAALNAARHFLEAGGALNVRANVMLIGRRRPPLYKDRLAIKWHTENYNQRELSTKFPQDGSGAASTAWSRDCLTIGIWDLNDVGKAEHRLAKKGGSGVNVTGLVQGADRDERIQTVLAIPLHDSDGDVKGILNLDDVHPWRESILLKESFIRAAKELRNECERLTSLHLTEM
jgi:hypothetical protein